jgi:N-acyl-D-amino-acid deacylase
MHRALLRNGTILDGTGGPAFAGHLLIEGNRIAAVVRQGDTPPPAETVLDVSGCAVAPGFIDMHSHSDWILPLSNHLWRSDKLSRC